MKESTVENKPKNLCTKLWGEFSIRIGEKEVSDQSNQSKKALAALKISDRNFKKRPPGRIGVFIASVTAHKIDKGISAHTRMPCRSHSR